MIGMEPSGPASPEDAFHEAVRACRRAVKRYRQAAAAVEAMDEHTRMADLAVLSAMGRLQKCVAGHVAFTAQILALGEELTLAMADATAHWKPLADKRAKAFAGFPAAVRKYRAIQAAKLRADRRAVRSGEVEAVPSEILKVWQRCWAKMERLAIEASKRGDDHPQSVVHFLSERAQKWAKVIGQRRNRGASAEQLATDRQENSAGAIRAELKAAARVLRVAVAGWRKLADASLEDWLYADSAVRASMLLDDVTGTLDRLCAEARACPGLANEVAQLDAENQTAIRENVAWGTQHGMRQDEREARRRAEC